MTGADHSNATSSPDDFKAVYEVPDIYLNEFQDQSAQLPDSLTKFCDHRGLDVLLNGELKVTPPREFNDPFEFSPGIWSREPSVDDLRDHFLAPDGFARMAFFDRVGNGSEERYVRWVEEIVLKRPDLVPRHLSWLRERVRELFSQNFGVACFSGFSSESMSSADAVRHWTIYGATHRGLAIEFDGKHEFFRKWARMKLCFSITYQEDRPKCVLADFRDLGACGHLRRLRRWGAVKSKAWETEREWRLITCLTDHPKIPLRRVVHGERVMYFLRLWDKGHPDPGGVSMVRRVIVGCRASNDLKASVLATLNQPHLKGIKVVFARENDAEYRLDV